MKPPFKRPKLPRCLCKSYINWLLQIASPSLVMIRDNQETEKYWKDLDTYKKNVYQWKLQKRILTIEEYKQHEHEKRYRAYKKRIDEKRIESLNRFFEGLEQNGED